MRMLRLALEIDDSRFGHARMSPARFPAETPSESNLLARHLQKAMPRAGSIPGVGIRRTVVAIVLFAFVGLFSAAPAPAQGNANPTAASSAAETQVIADLVTRKCGQPPSRSQTQSFITWENCAYSYLLFDPFQVQTPGRTLLRGASKPAQTAPAFLLSLASNTPGLPYLGNTLVGVGSVPNATTIANATVVYSTALRRLADCTLAEDYLVLPYTNPDAGYYTTLTGAQDYLHQLSGLTSKPDVFATGCKTQVLGLPATFGPLVLGTTSSGAAISASLNNSGWAVSVTDLTANTVKTTQLTTNQGVFYAADLRGIGILDLVGEGLTDPATNKISTGVFLGNGDGTFKAPAYYDARVNPGNFTVDDVDGDGKPDIVIESYILNGGSPPTATVDVLLGNGDGTFTNGPTPSSSLVAYSNQFMTGDFNGDSRKDLLIGGTVLFGAGDGSFTVGPVNSLGKAGAQAVGDLRNTGKSDVVVVGDGTVGIFYSNGDGTFAAGPTYAGIPLGAQPTITDLDGDGNMDIFAGTSSGGVYTISSADVPVPFYQVLMGHGDGTFVDSQAYPGGLFGSGLGHAGSGPEIASADFTGDGLADLLMLSMGTGAPQSPMLSVRPGDGKNNLGAVIASPISFLGSTLVAADMNGDKKLDAVVAGGYGGGNMLAVLTGQGDGTFTGEKDYNLPGTPLNLVTGDFNGDGLMDVAVAVFSPLGYTAEATGVYVLLGQSNGTLGSPVQIDSSSVPVGLAVADLNQDGYLDVVVADAGNTTYNDSGVVTSTTPSAVHVYLGKGDGTFTAGAAPNLPAAAFGVVALRDLNNDGIADLIVTGTVPDAVLTSEVDTNVYTMLGKGDGTFQAVTTLNIDTNNAASLSIALADFNGDGNLDVAVGNPADYTYVLYGNGDGTLVETALALGQVPATVGAANLVSGGLPVLLVGQTGLTYSGSLAVFTHNAATVTTTLTATTATLTASQTSATVGANIMFTATIAGVAGSTGTPSGTVTFMDGTTVLGTGTLSSGVATYSTTSLVAGSHSITAVYGGDTNFTGSTSTPVAVTVNAVPVVATVTTLMASPTSALVGASVAFATTVTAASGTVIPAGTVTFSDGSTAIGTGTLDGTGKVTLSTTTLPAGPHTITAFYGGATTFATSTSPAVTVSITMPTPDFSLGLSVTNGTVTKGGAASATLTVTPVNGFNSSVSFACSGLPASVTCSFNPSTVTPSGAAATTTVTVAESASAMLRRDRNRDMDSSGATAVLSALGFSCFLITGRRRRKTIDSFRSVSFVLFAIVLSMLIAVAGCGHGSPTQAATPVTSSVTITATSGSLSHTASYTLISQ